MNGGDGNDTYFVDNVGDLITGEIDDSTGGTADLVNASVTYSLVAAMENLTLTGAAAINGTGNSKNNLINGNGANNTLDGGTGADTMNGGDGNDTYIVDNIGDLIAGEFDDAEGGTADLVNASVTYTLVAAMENLTLTGAAAIDGTGNAKDNVINGTTGANTLLGSDGDDTLFGDNGNDILDGGTGADAMNGDDNDDTYHVDNVGDTAFESFNDEFGGVDTVNSTVDHALGFGIENLNLSGGDISGAGNSNNNIIKGTEGVNTLLGEDGSDTLFGDNGNDILDGGTGADSMNGGDQNDIYFVDNVGDTAFEDFNDSTGGVDTVNSTVSHTLGFGIENLTLSGVANINGAGNTNNNAINGNAVINTLDGGDGNDSLNGLAGNDILNGGNGNDILIGGLGADVMTGGLGNDNYFINAAPDVVVEAAGVGTGADTVNSTISYLLGLNLENLTLTGAANLNGVGNTVNNLIRGNGGANILQGGDGNDNLIGNAGNDNLQGGLGNDILQGNLGNDILNGGAGLDSFLFNAALGAGNVDTITGFSVADDTIRLENAIFTSFAVPGAIAAGNFVKGVGAVALDANDFLVYNTANGALSYDANGSAAGGAVQFATLVGIPPITAADFLIV